MDNAFTRHSVALHYRGGTGIERLHKFNFQRNLYRKSDDALEFGCTRRYRNHCNRNRHRLTGIDYLLTKSCFEQNRQNNQVSAQNNKKEEECVYAIKFFSALPE